MGLSDLVYGVYERRLHAQLTGAAESGRTPKHVGVILDGNRRWASAQGSASSVGHAAGAAKIVDFLGWCDDANVEVVTLWLLSTDNLARPHAELEALLSIIEETVQGLVGQGRWRLAGRIQPRNARGTGQTGEGTCSYGHPDRGQLRPGHDGPAARAISPA